MQTDASVGSRSFKEFVKKSKKTRGRDGANTDTDRTVATSTSTRGYMPNDSAQVLVGFLESKGAKGVASGVEIGISDSGIRGVFAMRAFQSGDCVCAIPFSATIVLDERSVEKTVSDAQLGAIFMNDILEDSIASRIWKPYFDSLSTKHRYFDPTPDLFSDEEIQSLKLPSVVKNVMKRKQQIIATALLEDMDLESLTFATWLVTKRKFTISKTTQRKTVLIPFLDMLNHSSRHVNAEVRK